jgi:hypothetical protein
MKTARAARIFDRWVAEQGLTVFVAALLANDPPSAWRSSTVVVRRLASAKDQVLATALFRGMWKRERGRDWPS